MKLKRVKVPPKNLSDYEDIVGANTIHELELLGDHIAGRRVVHINATPKGGGVEVLLHGIVPLLRDVGVLSDWFVIDAPQEFFEVTKKFHNALQGDMTPISEEEAKLYLSANKTCSTIFDRVKADLLIIHDLQPLASWYYCKDSLPNTSAIARMHIDLSTPSPQVLELLLPMLKSYDQTIFSLEKFVPDHFPKEKAAIIPPAIDPLSPKNFQMKRDDARHILSSFGIDENRPIISQVSRFDPWKNPTGVIDAYRIAKEEFHGLQLILLGIAFATDDPEQEEIFRRVQSHADGDPDIHLFFSPDDLKDVPNDEMVRAVQAGSDIVLQKSLREGFGLTATEAMWKGVPVIAGNVGGLALQIEDRVNGLLVNSPEEAGRAIIELLNDTNLNIRLGKAAHESVLEKYLITRLLRDHLELYGRMIPS